MNMHRRLEALEQSGKSREITRIRRIVMVPGVNDAEQLPVLGWQGGGVETLRKKGESESECWDRHDAALDAAHGKGSVVLNAQIIDKPDL